jgi:hypothetical protein
MNRDHMQAWRDYLGGEMHERLGIEHHEAQKRVATWLRSLGRTSTYGSRPPSDASRIRRQRSSSRESMRAKTAS